MILHSCFGSHLRIFIKAMVVSRELIRVAILWQELWHEGLEEASRLFFTEKNPAGMIAVLDPLHDTLEAVSFPSFAFPVSSSSGANHSQRNLFCPTFRQRTTRSS
jgi:phosphatidylinositol kinase/protein kinase (PI-3  family)